MNPAFHKTGVTPAGGNFGVDLGSQTASLPRDRPFAERSKVSQAAANQQLTKREREVLELILGAHSTREIANELGIEQRTVKAYVGRLMRKSGADNRISSRCRLSADLLCPETHGQTQRGYGSHESATK
jgi:DNA-binding CsgD family transcriptional regulator